MRYYFYTIQSLIKNPKSVAVQFLEDGSPGISHPFLCLVISAVLSSIILSIGFGLAAFPSFQITGIPEEEIARIIGVWISAADFRAFTQFLPLLMAFLLTPALSLAGLFFFREQLASFYRNLVLSGYLMSLVVIFQIALIPVWLIGGDAYAEPAYYRYVPAVIAALVLMRSYSQFFNANSAIMWVRIISVTASGYALFVFIGVFINSVIGYMAFAVNRIMEVAF